MARLLRLVLLALTGQAALASAALAQAGSGSSGFGAGGGGGFSGGGGSGSGSGASADPIAVLLFFGAFGLFLLYLVFHSARYRGKVRERDERVRTASAEAAEDDALRAEFAAVVEEGRSCEGPDHPPGPVRGWLRACAPGDKIGKSTKTG